MTKKTFGWFPDADVTRQVEPTTISTRFGDGYEQRAPQSLTPVLDKWELTFSGGRPEIDAIDQFLTEHRGAYSFIWINPDEVEGHYVCRSWDKQRRHGVIVSLTASFEQVPEL